MKKIVFALLLFASVVAYTVHSKAVREAEAAAAEVAREEARAEAQAVVNKEREARRVADEEHGRQERDRAAREEAERLAALFRRSMAVSKVVEPLMINVLAPLNVAQPADLVPVIEITKQRILDKQVHAEAGRVPVYERAATVMNYLVSLAEERTKSLEAMLKNRRTAITTMDRPTAASSGNFFNQNVTKRWEETLNRARPVLAQLVEQLRSAERDWNKQVDKNAAPEEYDLPQLPPLMIPTEETASASPLGSGTKNGTITRPWRNSYYYANGYRYPVYTP